MTLPQGSMTGINDKKKIRKRMLRKRFVTLLFIFCLVVGTGAGSIILDPACAAAKKKPSISHKTVTLTYGKTATIKLRNAKKKVKWKSGNKKIVKISKVKGKKKNTVVIKAGRKTGETYVRAKVGKKTYKCKVIVTKTVTASQEGSIVIRPISSSSVELSSGIKHDTGLNKEASEQFIKSTANFSINLFKATSNSGSRSSNVLISPDSVMTALAMLENGAQGDTLSEIEAVLGGGIGVSDFNVYLASMNNRLCSSKNVIWSQANSIWVRKNGISVKDSFVSKNKKYHDAAYYVAPFNSQTVTDMNNWVFNNTRNMIDNIISGLSPEDMMVLINTVVFEGSWAEPFGTPANGTFTTAGGQKQSVPMLAETGSLEYLELKGGKGFVKKYSGGDLAFAGILPPAGTGIDSYIASISGTDFISAWRGRSNRSLRITMPKFKYDYSESMSGILQGMGIIKAFTNEADFSGMFNPSASMPSIYVDEVIHKTHIEVDENGTKAAAATAIMMKAGSVMQQNVTEIILDRPFLYAIVDTQTGLPLFIGAVRTIQ